MYRLLLLLAVIPYAAAQLASCFFPNSQQVPLSRGYQPCVSTQNIVSMCCVLNITVLASLGESYNNFDSCLTNGLCQTPASHHSRGFCTDPTWKSPNCLNACTDPSVSTINTLGMRD
ncbi:hypothetical protein N431DRAFT_88937 [Stipitochalara longipes BDJ]|nr:hypothetical protein N431DRAFT_88937 [Stipitochalara longipes BDJ]